MAHYRDDTHEIAVAASSVWGGLVSIVEDLARASEHVMHGLVLLHAVGAVASDEVIDLPGSIIVEQAQVSDTLLGTTLIFNMVEEQAQAVDEVVPRLRVLHEDTAEVSDGVTDRTGSLVVEFAQASDEIIGARSTTSLIVETATVSDHTVQAASIVVQEQAQASDLCIQRGHFYTLIEDDATVAVEIQEAHQIPAFLIVDSATASDEVLDRLTAFNLVAEQVVAEDALLGDALGQAWTANTDSWAMSRYAPYTYDGLAVIDGALYGIANDGVYALDGGSDVIEGELRTGKLDLGRGGLVHPVAAYMEYSLAEDGVSEMDVLTTQTGTEQSYTYQLPEKAASELVSSRFTFGRGLRGRHFGFTLRLAGQSGHVNDLSVHVAPTKRRV